MNLAELHDAIRALRDIPLWTHTIVCHPDDEDRVLATAPDGLRVQTTRYVGPGVMYVLDDSALDAARRAL